MNDNFENNNFENDNLENDNLDTYSSTREEMRQPSRPAVNVFALFARSLGVFSIFCAVFSIFFGAFLCGGMAIVLAFLSKGYSPKMEKNAKIGLVTGLVGVVFQISVLVISVYSVLTVPEYREQFNILYEQMYGTSLEESMEDFMEQLEGTDMEGGIF